MAVKRDLGSDAFGKFTFATAFDCGVCMRPNVRTIAYHKGKLDFGDGIEVRKTILRTPETRIGINCGCYGKLHRQVAHITHRREARSAPN
jgi:hypothetical protein